MPVHRPQACGVYRQGALGGPGCTPPPQTAGSPPPPQWNHRTKRSLAPTSEKLQHPVVRQAAPEAPHHPAADPLTAASTGTEAPADQPPHPQHPWGAEQRQTTPAEPPEAASKEEMLCPHMHTAYVTERVCRDTAQGWNMCPHVCLIEHVCRGMEHVSTHMGRILIKLTDGMNYL